MGSYAVSERSDTVNAITGSVKRSDFDDKAEGRAKYCADLRFDGMLYGKTVRSTRSRAKIVSVELPPLPEGVFTVDHRDVPNKNALPIVFEDEPIFAASEVRYIGEPILILAGPDRQVLSELAARIEIRYEDMEPVLTIEQAMKESRTDNFFGKSTFAEYEYTKGDFEGAVRASVRVVEDEFRTGYQEHVYLEPQSMVGVYEGGKVTVYGSMQCPYYVVDALKMALGWGQEKIRVVQTPTGGGFGGKEDFPSLIGVHAALASIKCGKPVQIVYDREEDISFTTKRHPSVIHIKSYIGADNSILAREADIKTDGGAYAGLSSVVLQRLCVSVFGVYHIENLKVTAKAYSTNNIVSSAFRGFGGPQAFFAAEMHMEHVASELGVEPLALKKNYFLRKGDTSSTGGLFTGDIKLGEILGTVDELSRYTEKRTDPNRAGLTGVGCSVFFHGCGFTGRGEADLIGARVRLKKYKNGTVEIFVSNAEIGQGVLTTLRKIVAKTLGIPLEKVLHTYPDTDTTPDSGPTVASRTALIVGKLLQDCAAQMKERWGEDEFELTRGYEYPDYLRWDNEAMSGNAYPDYSWGANVAEVEVDPLTFEVRVRGIWGVYDIGVPLDERIVQGQIEGGIVQGLGYALMESMESKDGHVRQSNLTTYIIPCASDFPDAEFRFIDNPSVDGPFGARGLGEVPLVGVAPAVVAAIEQAIGHRVTAIPVTPELIGRLMKDGK